MIVERKRERGRLDSEEPVDSLCSDAVTAE